LAITPPKKYLNSLKFAHIIEIDEI